VAGDGNAAPELGGPGQKKPDDTPPGPA
jgi:hypothetical protein